MFAARVWSGETQTGNATCLGSLSGNTLWLTAAHVAKSNSGALSIRPVSSQTGVLQARVAGWSHVFADKRIDLAVLLTESCEQTHSQIACLDRRLPAILNGIHPAKSEPTVAKLLPGRPEIVSRQTGFSGTFEIGSATELDDELCTLRTADPNSNTGGLSGSGVFQGEHLVGVFCGDEPGGTVLVHWLDQWPNMVPPEVVELTWNRRPPLGWLESWNSLSAQDGGDNPIAELVEKNRDVGACIVCSSNRFIDLYLQRRAAADPHWWSRMVLATARNCASNPQQEAAWIKSELLDQLDYLAGKERNRTGQNQVFERRIASSAQHISPLVVCLRSANKRLAQLVAPKDKLVPGTIFLITCLDLKEGELFGPEEWVTLS